MKQFARAIMGLFCICFVTVSSSSLFAITNKQPDDNEQARSLRTPYSLKPRALVELGKPNTEVGYTPPGRAADVYNVLNPYFHKRVSQEDYYNPHFDYRNKNLYDGLNFKRTHKEVAPFSIGSKCCETNHRVYFVDEQAGYKNALGIMDTSKYPGNTTTHPFTNVPAGTENLLFPYTQDAVKHLPGNRGGDGLGRFVNNPKTPFYENNEHPLLLSDSVGFSLQKGQFADFFLANDIGDISKDRLNPTGLGSGTDKGQAWFTTMKYNWGETQENFQHFKFYQMPELADGIYDYHLVAVEDKNCSDYDFNDLFFVIQSTRCPVPEPSFYLAVGSLLFFAFMMRRKHATA